MIDEKIEVQEENPEDVSSTSEENTQKVEETTAEETGETEEGTGQPVPYNRFKEVIDEKNQAKQERQEMKQRLDNIEQQKQQQTPAPVEEKEPVLSEFPTGEEIKNYNDYRERQLFLKYQQDTLSRENARGQIDQFKKDNPDLAKHTDLVGNFLGRITQSKPNLLPTQRLEEAKKQAREYLTQIRNEGREEVKKGITKTNNATVTTGGVGKPATKKDENTPLTREEYLKSRGEE